MSNRRKTKNEMDLKLLEVTDDPTYRQQKKKTPHSHSARVDVDITSVAEITTRQKTLH